MFAGKAVIVTGSGSGIGAATARRLAAEGAGVLLADIDLDRAERVAARIRDDGGRATAMRCDVASAEDNDAIAAAAIRDYGGIDGVYLNAGLLGPAESFATIDMARFDPIVGVNLRGPLHGMSMALRHVRPGGAAVVTASLAGVMGLPSGPIYSATKHAVLGLVRSAAPAFAAQQLRVNAICPGRVDTPMIGVSEEAPIVAADALPVLPVGGPLDPQHIAEIALFLLSRAAAAINGQAIVADVGMTAAIGSGR